MGKFTGKRAIENYDGRIDSPPGDVFPLLCPIREYDWLDGWACNVVYSDSGIVENNCIFTSSFATGIDGTWVTVKRDEEAFEFEFVVFLPNLAVARSDIALTKNDDGSTTLHWVRTMTGLSEEGNQMLDHVTGEPFRERMVWIIDSLNHYLKNGEMLKKG